MIGVVPIGKHEIQGGLPAISGRVEGTKNASVYKCKKCNRSFYEPVEDMGDLSPTRAGSQSVSENVMPVVDMEQQRFLKNTRPELWDYLNAIPFITNEDDYQKYSSKMRLMMLKYNLSHKVDSWEEFDKRNNAEGIAEAILLSKKQIIRRKRWWNFWE